MSARSDPRKGADGRGGIVFSAESAIAVFALMMIAACTPPPPGEGAPEWTVEVQQARTGGLCSGPDGYGAVCGLSVTVRDDGRWTAEGEPVPTDTAGSVEAGTATRLAAILEEGWADLTKRPFTGTCPVAYDGQESIWTIRRLPRGPGAELADAAVRELRSCTHDLDHRAARRWLDRFEATWAEAGLPS